MKLVSVATAILGVNRQAGLGEEQHMKHRKYCGADATQQHLHLSLTDTSFYRIHHSIPLVSEQIIFLIVPHLSFSLSILLFQYFRRERIMKFNFPIMFPDYVCKKNTFRTLFPGIVQHLSTLIFETLWTKEIGDILNYILFNTLSVFIPRMEDVVPTCSSH